MLNEFRSTSITWDKATSRIYSPVTANASDENGRKLVVQIVNSGQVEDLTGATLHLYWETRDKAHYGLDVFKAVDLKKGEFELSYTTGMLSNRGVLNANLVLIDTVGRVVSERFKITVTEGIDDDAIQSENSFSSLTKALIDISNLEQNYAPRLNDLTAQLQQTMTQTEFDSWVATLLDGGPSIFMDTLVALQVAYPNGSAGVALVRETDPARIYVWDGSGWKDFGVYQGIELKDGTVTHEKTTLKASFEQVDQSVEYLTGRRETNTVLTQNDLSIVRATYTVESNGDIILSDNTTNFAVSYLPENVAEFEFVVTYSNHVTYIITGVSDDEIHMIGFAGSSAGKGYKVTNNGMTLGSRIINQTIPEVVKGDVVKVTRNTDGIAIKKNGVDLILLKSADYPSLHKNRFGFLSASNINNVRIAESAKINAVTLSEVSGIDKIETAYQFATESTLPEIDYYSAKKWGTVGDSITANNGDNGSVDYGTNYRLQVQELLGIGNINNRAFTGTAIARNSNLTNDQYAMHLRYDALDNDCDIVTIFGGTNDYRGSGLEGVPIGSKGSTDNYEFYGAMKTLLEGLITKFPKGKIGFITPLRRKNDTLPNMQGHALKDYVDAIKDMCTDYSIPVLDLYSAGGINPQNLSVLTTDGLHPNQLGYEMISRKIAKFIDGL